LTVSMLVTMSCAETATNATQRKNEITNTEMANVNVLFFN